MRARRRIQIRIDDIKMETVLNSIPADNDIDYVELWHSIIDDFNDLKRYIKDHVLGYNDNELYKSKSLLQYIETLSNDVDFELNDYHVSELNDLEAGIFREIYRAIRKIIGSATVEYSYVDHYYQNDDIVLILGYVDLDRRGDNMDKETFISIDNNFKRLLNIGIKQYVSSR